MRIGIFTDTYPPFVNGVSTSIKVLQDALEKKGHEVFIVTVNTKKMGYDLTDNKIIKIPGIPIGIYDYRLTGIYPLKVINKIRKWKLDVIHSHTEFGVGIFARLFSKQFDIPIVHTYHTMYEDYVHYVTKGFFDKTSKKIVKHLTDFYCDKTAKELIVPTKKTYDLFKEKYNYTKDIHIVPTGIPLEKYYSKTYLKSEIDNLRIKNNVSSDDLNILFVGRIAKEKNIEFLIDSVKDAIKKTNNIKLYIIGDGPELNTYIKRVEKLKLENNIMFLGKIPYEEIGKYYQLVNLFVTASTSETQGLTIIEALAASLPILVIDDEAFKNVIEDGYNGYVFKNKKELTKRIIELKKDESLLNELSKQAFFSADKHSDKFFADRVVSVYEKACSYIKPETLLSKIRKKLKKQ